MIKKDRSRFHAYNIILAHESSGRQLKSVRNDYFSTNNLSSSERSRSMALSNEVVRWKRTLDNWIARSLKKPIKKLPLKVLCILRLGYYEYVMDSFVPAHAAVDSWVELSKKLKNKKISGLVNAILRKASSINKHSLNNRGNIGFQFSFQDWMVESWIEKYGRSKAIELCTYLL